MRVRVHGTDLSALYTPAELEAIQPVFMAEDAQYGQGSMPIPDTTGILELYAGQRVILDEPDGLGGYITIFDGFLGAIDHERGETATGDRQSPKYTIVDQNAFLHGTRAWRWSRPAETDRARMLAWVAKYLPGFIDTTFVIDDANKDLQKQVYRTEDWVSDFLQEAGDLTAKTLFVVNHELHWHLETAGDTAGLEISDAAFDYVGVFPPDNPQRHKDPQELGNNILVYNSKGQIYRATDATSLARHDADNINHQRLIELPDASAARLQSVADQTLRGIKNERIGYECDIGPLTAAQVAQIPVGSLIRVTSSVMRLSGSTQRIAALKLTYKHPGIWFAHLTLGFTKRIRRRAGALPPTPLTPSSTVPFRKVCTPAIGEHGQYSLTMGPSQLLNPPDSDPGHFWSAQTLVVPGGTCVIVRQFVTRQIATSVGLQILSSILYGTGIKITGTPGTAAAWNELETPPVWYSGDGQGVWEGDPWDGISAPPAGWYGPYGTPGGPDVTLALYANTFGATPTENVFSIRFDVTTDPANYVPSEATPEDCSLPLPGQPVLNETVVADGTTATFSTNYAPYAEGSIRVQYASAADQPFADIVVTETDPDAGTITLGFIPPKGAILRISYVAGFAATDTGAGNAEGTDSGPTLTPPAGLVLSDIVVGAIPGTLEVGTAPTAAHGDHGPHLTVADIPGPTTRWEPLCSYDGTVVLDSHLDPVMVEVTI
jgi:hypothetical protein